MPSRFVVATYNVLADAYIKPGYFPRTPADLLEPAAREGRLFERIEALDADLICLQELEAPRFARLEPGLGAMGYAGDYAQKGRGKPDGCATFWRRSVFTVRHTIRLPYADGRGGPDSGHVAQLLLLEWEGGVVGLANTHIRWDRPERPVAEHIGLRQARLLLEETDAVQPEPAAWILCGDFNAEPDHAVLEAMRERGYADAHHEHPAPTCNATGPARKLDYLMHSAGLSATPLAPPTIDETTPLPSEREPSDHLPLRARFACAE